MNTSSPRRKILRAIPVAAVAGLSGCLGSASDDSDPSCTMFDHAGEKTPPLRDAKVVPWGGGPATLRVTLVASEVEETGAQWITVYEPETNASGPEYAIPLDVGDDGPTDLTGENDVVVKEQAIGATPAAGRFRVEIEDEDETVLAWTAFSFDCSSDEHQY